MEYRRLGRAKDELSILGFGCMRFSTGQEGEIDYEETKKMIRGAIDSGVNYIDTAWPYHMEKSEETVGKILQDGYREKVFLATKLPSWLIHTKEDMEKYLQLQLKKLQTEYIDYYLVHALNENYWKNLKELDVFSFLDEQLKKGTIRHVGFSFHDSLPLFKEIVDAYDWTFCQIQYNFLNEDYQAGREGLDYAYEKGLGVIIMEPLMGGKLTKRIPEDVKALWESAKTHRTPAEWGLRWLWDQEKVSVVLSGMSEEAQIRENIRIASQSPANHLLQEEKQLIQQVAKRYFEKIQYGCTECEYCMPCPNGVKIPTVLNLYNEKYMYEEDNQKTYRTLKEKNMGPDACIDCGMCEEKCPQHLPIREALQKIQKEYESK